MKIMTWAPILPVSLSESRLCETEDTLDQSNQSLFYDDLLCCRYHAFPGGDQPAHMSTVEPNRLLPIHSREAHMELILTQYDDEPLAHSPYQRRIFISHSAEGAPMPPSDRAWSSISFQREHRYRARYKNKYKSLID
jgi:hypothetical protein